MESPVRPEAALIQIQELLGEGLSSRVFAALRQDSRGFSRQEIVLKILKTETDVSWMKREFEVLSLIRSPHCVRILGWENLPEGPALVLERIAGVTILEMAVAGTLTSDEQDEIVAQIQEGLKAVHEVGLHHGDLSPGNVMVDRDGCVRLIDFALMASRSGVVLGTPPYIAPEVWRGEPSGPAADLFALGLLREDLRDGLASVSVNGDACRRRAQTACGRGSLLAEAPEERAFLSLESRSLVRESLARRVRVLLGEREARRLSTQVMTPLRSPLLKRLLSAPKHRICAALLCVLVMGAPTFSSVTVDASVVEGPLPVGGRLEVRTLRWVEVALDGRKIGFAPVTIGSLAPGEYALQWRDSRRHGELRLQVHPGARIVVTDRELDATPGND